MAALAVLVAVLGFAACGDSKPQYCSDRSNLEKSVNGLTDISLGTEALNQLESQLKKVETDAKSLADSAKSDFPTETNAIESSVNAPGTAIDGPGSSPAAAQIA